jgi:hypothetical protein
MRAWISALGFTALTTFPLHSAVAGSPQDVWVVPLPKAEAVSDIDRDRAGKAFERAQAAYAKGQAAKALEAMEYAYKTVPNASTAMTRAFILGALGRHREALEGYLVAANLDPTEEEHQTIDAGFKKHGQALELAVVEVAVIPHDAAITVNGRALEGRTFVAVTPGDHTVRAEAAGHRPMEVGLAVVAGVFTVVDRTLERLPVVEAPKPEVKPTPPVTPDPTTAVAETPSSKPQVAEWVLTASGVGAVVAGGVLLERAVSKHKDTSEQITDGTIDQGAHARAGTEINGFWIAGWVLVGAGAAALGVGILLFALPDADPEPTEGPHLGGAAPLVWPGGGGVGVHGRF